MTHDFFLIALIILLTLGSGFFSGSETALFSLSPPTVQTYKGSQDPKKRLIAKLLSRPRGLLVTVFMLNVFVNILLQNVCSSLFGVESGWLFQVGVPLLITLVLGEIIPKNLGMQYNKKFAHATVTTIYWFHRVIAPIRNVTEWVTSPISKILFFYLKKEESISEYELSHVLKTSEKEGVLSSGEANLVRGYLSLQNNSIKEVMVPRDEIIYYEISEPLTKLTHLFSEQEVTRLPVCSGDIDNVLGILTAKSYFLRRDLIQKPEDIKKWLKKPYYVPETTQAQVLLRQLNENLEVFALVIDEYGQIEGLVTKEDLVEEVIGEITDRRDEKEWYTRSSHNEIIASGKLELSELNALFDLSLKSEAGMITVNGWLTEKMGEIPSPGTTYETDHAVFQILSSIPSRIQSVYIKKKEAL
ncbi:MAG: hemolysin family protein [Waddliaceae bacterium]